MTPQVIGLCGKRRHGKDTVADHLVREHGAVKLGFGNAVLADLEEVLGLSLGPDYESAKAANLALMQDWGLARRRADRDYWVKKLEALIHGLVGVDLVAVSGVRAENEIAMVHRFGGQVWRIVRPGLPPDPDHDAHEIENLIDGLTVDVQFENPEGDPAALLGQIDTWLDAPCHRGDPCADPAELDLARRLDLAQLPD